jgi:hypothetical protein
MQAKVDCRRSQVVVGLRTDDSTRGARPPVAGVETPDHLDFSPFDSLAL